MEHVNTIKAGIAAIVAVLTALWGWLGWLVVGWVVCMVLDYITGSAAALSAGEWSSEAARRGIWHKAGCIATVAAAGILDAILGHLLRDIGQTVLPFQYTVFLCPLVLVWYVLTEVGSVVENAGKMGAPIPAWLRKAIASLRDKVDTTTTTEDDANE